jgi:hypothetical protein
MKTPGAGGDGDDADGHKLDMLIARDGNLFYHLL